MTRIPIKVPSLQGWLIKAGIKIWLITLLNTKDQLRRLIYTLYDVKAPTVLTRAKAASFASARNVGIKVIMKTASADLFGLL